MKKYNRYTNSNKILIEIIQQVSDSPESERVVNARDDYKSIRRFYLDKTIDAINHLESETFYTREYLDQIKVLLGDPESFTSLPDYNIKLIQSELDKLSHDDYLLKTYLHKSVHESKNINKLFPIPFAKFQKEWATLLAGNGSQRGYKYSIRYKFKLFYSKIIELLLEKNYEIDFIQDMTDQDLNTIFKDYLTPYVVFDVFCVILLKTARDTLLSNRENVFNNVSMSVLQHQVIYHIYRHMVIISITHAVTYKVQKSRKVIPLDSLLRSIRNFLTHEFPSINCTEEYASFIDGIHGLFKSFSSSGVFHSVVKERAGSKDFIRFHFPSELSDNLGRYTTTPRVCKPNLVTSHNLIEIKIPTDFASMEIAPSSEFIQSLNISNRKCFSINQNFLLILEHLDSDKYFHCQINRPIPSRSDLLNLKRKRDSYLCELSNFSSHIVDLIQTEISKKNKKLAHPHQYRYLVNQTKSEAVALSEKQQYSNLYQTMAIERKAGKTRLLLSYILNNFPLYYTNNICSTTRVFAKEYLLSRHIGCLKLLRGEHHSRDVTVEGIKYMLEAYYSDDANILTEFKEYLSNKPKYNKEDLQEFFETNSIDYASKTSVTHFMLLAVELKKVFATGKTKLLLQYDQVASGLVFIGLLWKNVKLGKVTNVMLSETASMGPYDYALSEFETYYTKNIDEKNFKVLEFVGSTKKLHKYALMCYSYNQTPHGRTNSFVDFWVDKFGTKPSQPEWMCLNEISIKYTDFINELFPGINNQFEVLDKIVQLVVKNAGYLKIRTIDGAVITWKFYKKKHSSRKTFNPHTMMPESYSLYSGVIDSTGLPTIDPAQYKLKFRSYLVHSVDAGVMRSIIRKMYEHHDYRVDQLHDCILLHPNYVDSFYKVVEDIYKGECFTDYMNTYVFQEFRGIISSDKLKEFDKLVDKFNKDQDPDFKISGDFRKIYKPEV